MRAARYYGKEDIRVEEIEEPVCKPGQLKIKPAFVGICGTGISPSLTSIPATASSLYEEHLPTPQTCTNTSAGRTSHL
jgi:threonine dehydrogenase-like Zn-dependent dehydrogenase